MADIKDRRWLVDHTSLLDVNKGQQVQLEVYEYVEEPRRPALEDFGPIVLMVHGRSQNSNATLVDWAVRLADQGVHVFTMNFQGLGAARDLPYGSPRPSVMDEPFNANRGDLPKLYTKDVPPPPLPGLDAGGQPRPGVPYLYPRWLSDTNAELAQLWSVLHWISTTQTAPIHIIAYSAGAFLAGPTAMIWPDMVKSLFLAAPMFPPAGLSDQPTVNPDDQATWPDYLKAPKFGFGWPFNIQTKAEVKAAWEDDQRLGAEPYPPGNEPAAWPGFLDSVWKLFQYQDPKTWWNYPEGLVRYPTRLWWGWNEAKVKGDTHLGNKVPVCIVYGSSDSQAITRVRVGGNVTVEPVIGSSYTLPPPQEWKPGPPFSCTRLFDDIQGNKKLMVALPKTGHYLPWEKHHIHLYDYSLDWINNQSIDGNRSGSYARNDTGQLVAA
jgi:alpha-beta hydrolase superfamily lysophospholipase